MRASISLLLGLSLSADACYVICKNAGTVDVGPNQTPCPGQQEFVYAAPGFADIVYFDGGKHYQCADSAGFNLAKIPQNIIGCSNGVRGRCCGTERC